MGCRCKCGASKTKHCWNKSEWALCCEFCGKPAEKNPCSQCEGALEDIKYEYEASLIEVGIEPDKDIPF